MGGHLWRRWRGSKRASGSRGATLVEYALGVSLVCIACLGAIQFVQREATDEYSDRADRAGAPDLGVSPGGDTGGTTTGGTDGGGPVPAIEVFFGGFQNISATVSGNWAAQVEVLVLDGAGNPVEGAAVTGVWSYVQPNGTTATETVPCEQTNSEGICPFQLSKINSSIPSVTFTMTTISGGVPPVQFNGDPEVVVVPKNPEAGP